MGKTQISLYAVFYMTMVQIGGIKYWYLILFCNRIFKITSLIMLHYG